MRCDVSQEAFFCRRVRCARAPRPTVNALTKNLDFGGLDSGGFLIVKGGIPGLVGGLTQAEP